MSFEWPGELIVPTREIINRLKARTAGTGLRDTDYREIMIQIVDLFLNFGKTANQSYHVLPECHRLFDQYMDERDPQTWKVVQTASIQAAVEFEQLIDEMRAWRTLQKGTTDWPYGFEKWLPSGDLMVSHMPF